jgi:BON domain-containing protein
MGSDDRTPKPRGEDEPEIGLVIGPTTGDADVQATLGPASRTGRRPDDVITSEIGRRLAASSLADHGIQVTVKKAMVTLRGCVRDDAERHLAEHLAESVAGVRAVESELRIAVDAVDRRPPRAGESERGAD